MSPKPRVYQAGGHDPIFGRIGQERVTQEFENRGICYQIGKDPSPEWLNDQGYQFLYWSWECNEVDRYRRLFEAVRKYRIVVFAQEQPQKLQQLREVAPFADFVFTSSPVYGNEFDGFLPFGIHDIDHIDGVNRNQPRRNAILLSGSFRHSRGQLFEHLLREQPFRWPVYMFPTCLEHDMIENDPTRQVVARHPRWCYPAAVSIKSYIRELLQHLTEHRVFIDFTTNSSNYLKFHEDMQVILDQARGLPGGYCPERVLDALWLGCSCFCLEDQAVRQVLGDHVAYYDSIDALVTQVNRHIDHLSDWDPETSSGFVDRYRTSRIMDRLAAFYKGGPAPGFASLGSAGQATMSR